MKKFFLFIFLITSIAIVSAKTTLQVANSLSPPVQSLDAIVKAQLPMLQVPLAETQQLDVCFFERDVFYSVWFENRQSVIPDKDVGLTDNFQVLTNSNSARTSSGNPDVLLAAISPNCRTVLADDFFQNDVTRNLVGKTQAVSPNCRDVLFVA